VTFADLILGSVLFAQNMQLLIITHKAVFPVDDGHSFAMAQGILGLCACGAKVHVLAMNTHKHQKPTELQHNPYPGNLTYETHSVNTTPGVLSALLNLCSAESYFVSRFRHIVFQNAIIARLKLQHFDIIQFEGIFPALYINIVKPLSKALCIIRTHNIEFQIWEERQQWLTNSIKSWYFKLQTARLKRYEIHQLQKADAWVPISKEDAAALKRLIKTDTPLHVAPTGIEIKHRKKQQAYKDLLFVGSLDWEPNRMGLNWFFLKIWPLLCQTHPAIQITLIGRGAQNYAKGILQCTAVDFVPDLNPYYETHQVVIIPILHGGGMRIKLLEAMAFGMPVVTTTKGNQGLHALAGQHVCVADTESDFLNAIVLLLTQPPLRQQFEKAAHDWVQKEFNQTQIMQGWFSQYQHWINTLCS